MTCNRLSLSDQAFATRSAGLTWARTLRLGAPGLLLLLAGCVGSRFAREAPHPVDVRAVIDSVLPAAVSDRGGWAADIAGGFTGLGLPPTRAASLVAGKPLTADGALLAKDPDAKGAGSTQQILFALAGRLRLSEADIHQALETGRTQRFEQTVLYRRVFALADRKNGWRLPRAAMPRIRLEGPKIERPLTTGWYARRVNGRFERCVRG